MPGLLGALRGRLVGTWRASGHLPLIWCDMAGKKSCMRVAMRVRKADFGVGFGR